MRALTLPTVALLSFLTLGCDAASELWSQATSGAAGKAPEGWESIDGASRAMRLYYQFNDPSGRVRFVERLDEVPESLRASVGFVKLDVAPPLSPGDARRARNARFGGSSRSTAKASAGGSSVRVVLYSAEWCGACRKAKRYLARRGIDYELRDVDNPQNAEELKQKTGARAVPVIDVGGRMLTGFSADSYDALIDRA